jgi:hypothetical protein
MRISPARARTLVVLQAGGETALGEVVRAQVSEAVC